MKKITVLGIILAGCNFLSAQELKLASEVIDLGRLKANQEVTSKIKVTNAGDKPLVLKDVKGSCGCTVVEYSKTPILPGSSVDIAVIYSAGSEAGDINRTVTITSNDIKASRAILRLKGTIE